MILLPNTEHPLNIDCYVDANFADLFGTEEPHDPSSVKSRTGMVLCVANCPVTWSSRLQHLIATSTTEAEYNSISDAMHEVIPLQNLTTQVAATIGFSDDI